MIAGDVVFKNYQVKLKGRRLRMLNCGAPGVARKLVISNLGPDNAYFSLDEPVGAKSKCVELCRQHQISLRMVSFEKIGLRGVISGGSATIQVLVERAIPIGAINSKSDAESFFQLQINALKNCFSVVKMEFSPRIYEDHLELWVYVLSVGRLKAVKKHLKGFDKEISWSGLPLWFIVKPWSGPWPPRESKESAKERAELKRRLEKRIKKCNPTP